MSYTNASKADDKSKHHMATSEARKLQNLQNSRTPSTDQTPPHSQRGILEAHAGITPRENGGVHSSRKMQEVP